MAHSILLTSFTTWKAEQTSNSSDDLLEILVQNHWLQNSHHLLRQVPVDFELAPAQVLATIARLRPAIVVCCGMAEDRDHVSIETQAVREETILTTTIDCTALLTDLRLTRLSQDAGRFVCNHLYYSVLHYLRTNPIPAPQANATPSGQTQSAADRAKRPEIPVGATGHCIFVHIPVLHPDNQDPIVTDFLTILHRLQSLVTC
ncbi:peptidase C15 [Trichothermofontia sp.]